jgi:phosphatidylserine decarboxylase
LKTQSQDTEKILVRDRASGKVFVEKVLGDRLLRLAYRQPWRNLLGGILFSTGLPSRVIGAYCDSRWSRTKIAHTLRDLDISLEDYQVPETGYQSFNEFFTRHLKANARPFDPDPACLCAPADARYSFYPAIRDDTCIPVKGREFAIHALLGCPPEEAQEFRGGCVIVARLCPVDYHRYHFPAAGRVLKQWEISGRYESVNPVALALKLPIFTENKRTVSLLELDGFGKVAYLEVGAFGVSGIVQTHSGERFDKMSEKGLFKFGGSTVVLVLPPDAVKLAKDLVQNTRDGYETLVKAGETLGRTGAN